MDSSLNVWVRRIGVLLLVCVAAVLLFPLSGRIVGPLLGFAAWAAAVFGYVFIFAGIPFLLFIVGRAGYKSLVKPYVRARRIRQIGNKRLLREAAARGDSR